MLKPSYNDTPAPIANIRIATTKVQKYNSMPYPNGCCSSAGFEALFMPHKSSPWLLVSTIECTASLSIAELPVIAEAIILVMAMRPLPIRAATTTHFDPDLGFN